MPLPPEEAPPGPAKVQVVRHGRLAVTRLHRSGVRPHRLLAIGSRSMLSSPDVAQAETIGERIADRVWLQTRRGVDLDLVWELRTALQVMRDGTSAWRLWRYDAVIVLLPNGSAGLGGWWRARGVAALLQDLIETAAATSRVLVVSVGDRGATAEQQHTEKKRTTWSPVKPDESAVPARVARFGTTLDPKAVADAVAQHLTGPLADADAAADEAGDARRQQRSRPDDEAQRQQALDELDLRARRITRQLQQVVDMARETFDSASAELSIMDHDERWIMAVSGLPSRDRSRQGSLCNDAIQRREPTVIGDTWAVPALRGNALQAGADPVRFYAAYPIESIAGYRIGVLCVWDDSPHEVDRVSVSTLRDLALLAEAELISANHESS